MINLNTKHEKADTFFVMLLFVLFAITAFTLILVGVKQYQVTADNMSSNYEIRTASSYLIEKVHQNDTSQGVSIVNLDGRKAIALGTEIDGRIYTTYIYYYDGYMRELLVSNDSVFTLEAGQPIIEIADLELLEIDSNIAKATITGTNQETITVFLSTKSAD